MKYWPGTNIVKSKGNAFDWHGRSSQIMNTPEMKMSNGAKLQMMGSKSQANITYITKKKNYGPKPLGDI